MLSTVLGACTSSGATGPATLSTDGQPRMVSAWATDSNASYLLAVNGGTTGYEPWEIVLAEVPEGTSCADGTGQGSLLHDASGWAVTIDIAVPYAQGDDPHTLAQLAPGAMPIADFGSDQPITQRTASVQVFDRAPGVDMLSAGTLEITSFDGDAIAGHFDGTGTGPTGSASGTFTATRCTF